MEFLSSIAKSSAYIIGTILAVSSAHWLLMFIYGYICVNFSFWGLITNTIYLGSPLCMLLNEVQFMLSKYYISIMTGAATSIIMWCGIRNIPKAKAN